MFGNGDQTIILAHGFGCDQAMWRYIIPFLEKHFKVLVFDYVGCGKSDISSYDKDRYGSLSGYAQDIIEICEDLNIEQSIKEASKRVNWKIYWNCLIQIILNGQIILLQWS